jgi:RNA polymerase sigma-70 factor, ECF subfamily
MRDDDWLAAEFEAARPRLHAVAYRMLGSHADADDAVQEAWLRLAGGDHDRIENAGGLLTTVVGRVCLDRLRTRRSRPEEPIEAIATATVGDDDPADHSVLADSVGSALLVVLDLLGPAERLAFVLHDVFAVPFDEIGEILDRSPEAARQLASRARRRLQGSDPDTGVDVERARQREVVDAFLRAAHGGDFEALVRLLDPEVVLVPDTAAMRMGPLRETVGATAVATALSGGAKGARLAIIDGLAGFVWAPTGQMRGVVEFTVANGKIVALRVTGDRQRLESLDIVPVD